LLTRLARAQVLALSGERAASVREASALAGELSRMQMQYHLGRCTELTRVTAAR
jgi:hypothetical protein